MVEQSLPVAKSSGTARTLHRWSQAPVTVLPMTANRVARGRRASGRGVEVGSRRLARTIEEPSGIVRNGPAVRRGHGTEIAPNLGHRTTSGRHEGPVRRRGQGRGAMRPRGQGRGPTSRAHNRPGTAVD